MIYYINNPWEKLRQLQNKRIQTLNLLNNSHKGNLSTEVRNDILQAREENLETDLEMLQHFIDLQFVTPVVKIRNDSYGL